MGISKSGGIYTKRDGTRVFRNLISILIDKCIQLVSKLVYSLYLPRPRFIFFVIEVISCRHWVYIR